MTDAIAAAQLTLTPIGWVRSSYQRRFGTPQQATAVDSDADAWVELDGSRIPAAAIADLDGMSYVWLITWLHKSSGTWAPQVRPPRGSRQRRGVFATRSPDRPNPLGLSAVRLVRVEGLRIYVRGIDLLDGTPVLDIKPYIPYADAFADAKAGWVDDIPRDALQIARYEPGSR